MGHRYSAVLIRDSNLGAVVRGELDVKVRVFWKELECAGELLACVLVECENAVASERYSFKDKLACLVSYSVVFFSNVGGEGDVR